MLFNYLKISFRKFTRQKFYSLLNIFGLATGMATVILIMLYVMDEVGFDSFHRYEKDLYRVVENQYYSGQPVFPVAVTPGPLADALKAEFPEVEMATRVHVGWNAFQQHDNRFDANGLYVDEDFLHMFDFPFLKGDTATALDEINSVILTKKVADKLFGQEEALGKIVKVNAEGEVVVTGVLADIPENSHMQFEYLMPMERRLIEVPSLKTEWGNNTLYTYIKFVHGSSPAQFNSKIQQYLKTKLEETVTELYLQPLSDIHLGEVSFAADFARKGNKQYVQIFSVIAIFILVIACINFMNLSTARAMNRAKEVGLRKTVGAYRYQLVLQFLGESVMVALVALALALLFVDLMLPAFNALTQKSLEVDYTNPTRGAIPVCLAATLFTGLLAGSYPAIFLSSFQPGHVLKGSYSGAVSGGPFRKVLVVLQFSISIVMISGTFVIYSQMQFIRNIDLGWDRQDLVIVPNVRNYETLRDRLRNYPQIGNISATNQHPSYVMNSTSGISWKGKPEGETILFHVQGVDYDYVETMKISLTAGRTFSKNSGDTLSTLINEEAARIIGFKNPIGEYLTASDEEVYQIIGIVKDFHFKSMHDRIEPLVMYFDRYDASNMIVRIEGDAKVAIGHIEDEWKSLNPGQLLSYKFLDEDFNNQYRAESQTGTIFRYFSVLAIVISCLGLFGLAAFTSAQKSKEYGIRKVFGASVTRLFYMASAEFVVLVVIAFFISLPVAWYWMQHWLDGFAYHVELSWMVFVGSGLLAMVIALVTVSYQAGKVGRINPARTLRAE